MRSQHVLPPQTSAGRAYLQIVESRRDGDQVRQQVIATLGRFEDLQASGQLERLVRSGARFAAKAMVLSAASNEAAIKIGVRRIGPALVFERLWEETGCRAVITALAGQRKHGFTLERAVFLTVLHRLFMSGSDRAADRWREDYAIVGVAVSICIISIGRWRGWARSCRRRAGRPHAVFAALPQGCGGGAAVRASARSADAARPGVHGHHQPLLRGRRRPDTGPARLQQGSSSGPAADDPRRAARWRWAAGMLGDVAGEHRRVTTLIPVIDRLRQRFDIARMCVVADRGMISAETVAELEARRLLYILGVRERSDKLVHELVLDHPTPFVPLMMKKRGKEIDYEVKTVMVAGRRYIVCRNRQEAAKDAADRASIVAALERQLAKGDKALVGNTGFRRYLKTISEKHFAIDPDKIEEEKKLDGIFVLRTDTDLNPLEAMLCYKQLWTVEQTFRTAKHLLTTRPIFHKLDETIRGHVFCSFLALVLKTELEERIAVLERVSSWPEIIADLDLLTETEIEYDGKHFIVRSAPRSAATLALRAAGVALPPTIRDAAVS